MKKLLGAVIAAIVLALFPAFPSSAVGEDQVTSWDKAAAAKYLDQRAKEWFEYEGAYRGQAANRSSCVSCHTLLPIALARPVLRKQMGETKPSEHETKVLEQTRKRVANWDQIDSKPFQLFYDFNEQKKKESWGTEAVINALLLTFDDRYEGRKEPSDSTKRALDHLWQTQRTEGDVKGAWDWLEFGNQPWEAPTSRYWGTTLAAVAVGTAPGNYQKSADLDNRLKLLRTYLHDNAAKQNLHERTWLLWSAAKLDGVLSDQERKKLIEEIASKQQSDGGWRLSSLGDFNRHDGTAQDTASDGYATGLIVHVLQTAGVPPADPAIHKGRAWLLANQSAQGPWRCISVNKKRNPDTLVGKFMADAATAYAVLALSPME